MAITVDWSAKIVSILQSDLTLISGSLYELNLDSFRLTLKTLEASEAGMPFDDIHQHNTEVTVAGTTLARVIEIINGYTITFEDLQYAVNLVAANSNVAQVTNVNQVSIRSFNTAGLITVTTGSGLSAAQNTELFAIRNVVPDGVWDEATADHVAAGSFGLRVSAIPTSSAVVDAVWDELLAGHLTAATFGRVMSDLDVPFKFGSVTSVVAPSTTSITTDLTSPSGANHWKEGFIRFTDGLLAGVVREITASAVTNGVLIFGNEALPLAPISGDNFAIINR